MNEHETSIHTEAQVEAASSADVDDLIFFNSPDWFASDR